MAALFLAQCSDGRCRPIRRTPTPNERTDVEITASVGVNAYNRYDDVRRIQDALNEVPHDQGGPSPSLNTDGICGPKTIAAIRRFQKEYCRFKWPDGRVEPNRRTHDALKERYVGANPYPLKMVHARLPFAVRWIHTARRVLLQARESLGSNLVLGKGSLDLVNKYFHLDELPGHSRIPACHRIDSNYVTMLACIGHHYAGTTPGSGYFQEDPLENQNYAYTFPGGFRQRDPATGGPVLSREAGNTKGPNVRTDAIYVCPRKLNQHSFEYYTIAIIHELAHFCGGLRDSKNFITDHAYRRDGRKFFQLSPDKAMKTADCYAHFAGEAAMGREVRVPELTY